MKLFGVDAASDEPLVLRVPVTGSLFVGLKQPPLQSEMGVEAAVRAAPLPRMTAYAPFHLADLPRETVMEQMSSKKRSQLQSRNVTPSRVEGPGTAPGVGDEHRPDSTSSSDSRRIPEKAKLL